MQLSEWEIERGDGTQRNDRNETVTEKADGDKELAAKTAKECKLAWERQAGKKFHKDVKLEAKRDETLVQGRRREKRRER